MSLVVSRRFILLSSSLRSLPTYPHRLSTGYHSPATPPITIKEPSENGRPTLYYHLLQVPVDNARTSSIYKWALSLLPSPPTSGRVDDKSVLGVLPARMSDLMDVKAEAKDVNIEQFEQNPHFVEVLHKAIQNSLHADADDALKSEAQARENGWIHIQDMRSSPALNRIPDPEDIIGSVLVERGRICPDSYQKMPTYRVVSGESGPLILPPKISSGLMELLQRE